MYLDQMNTFAHDINIKISQKACHRCLVMINIDKTTYSFGKDN
jgi:hypothetical protein